MTSTSYAPIFWVIPPASFCAICVCLILSNKVVFPWSTWPIIVIIGGRFSLFSISFKFEKSLRVFLTSSWIGMILTPNLSPTLTAVSISKTWLMLTITPSKNNVLMISVSETYICSANSCTEIGFDRNISSGFSIRKSFSDSLFLAFLLPFFVLFVLCFFIVFGSS